MIDSSALIVDYFHALMDDKTEQFPPLPSGETSLVEASTKHPGVGGGMPREERLRRKREQTKEWRIANADLKKSRDRASYRKHRDKRRASGAERYRKNKSKVLAYCHDYYLRNKKRIVAYNRALSEKLKRDQPARVASWRTKSRQKDRLRQYHYRRRPERIEKHRELSKKWNLLNPEKRRAMNESWVRRNPDKVRVNQIRRRAKPEDRPAIVDFVATIRRKRFFICYYCQTKTKAKDLRLDHIIPVSKGGLTVVGNLCASCNPCNCSKHAKLLPDWNKNGQQVLPV